MTDLTDDALYNLVKRLTRSRFLYTIPSGGEISERTPAIQAEAANTITALRQREATAIKHLGPIAELLPDAVSAAEKAMRKFPQPNYVISKWAEETGEVTKDLIHMAEGRQTADKVRGEMVQALAMLHRLLVEGDQVHGLPPVAAAILDAADKLGGKP